MASDWLLLVQTLVLAATAIPALWAVKTATDSSLRERRAARIRDDERRADLIADQIVRVSHTATEAKFGRLPIETMQAEQLRLKALLAPFSIFRLDAIRKYMEMDPTHASQDDVSAALEEIGTLTNTFRNLWNEQVAGDWS